MTFHRSELNRVASGYSRVSVNNGFRPFRVRQLNREHVVDYSQQSIGCWLNGLAARDGHVPVQDFLQDLGVIPQLAI